MIFEFLIFFLNFNFIKFLSLIMPSQDFPHDTNRFPIIHVSKLEK